MKKKKANIDFTLRLETPGRIVDGATPRITFVGGAHPYLWVGDCGCYGTLSKAAPLRRLAKAILTAIGTT